MSGNVITGASLSIVPAGPRSEAKPDSVPPIDVSLSSGPSRFQNELARDPWGRVMVTTPIRFPSWVPRPIRNQVEAGLPVKEDGLTRFSAENGREGVLYAKRSEGLRTYELFTYLPEDGATYFAITRGDADAARRLRASAKQWNREMRHFVEELGMAPSEAMAEIRRIDGEVLKQMIYAAALLVTSGAVLGTVRQLPEVQPPRKSASVSSREARELPAAAPKRSAGPGVAGNVRTIGSGDRAMTVTPKQLQKKFKHAKVLGVTGNYNPASADTFADVLERHILDPEVLVIHGTYRRRPVTHFHDPRTGVNVIRNEAGAFESAFKLKEEQAMNVLQRGSL